MDVAGRRSSPIVRLPLREVELIHGIVHLASPVFDLHIPQPDLSLRIRADYGGQSGMEGGYATDAPELIVEISDSSKLRLYERSGVPEYLVVQPREKLVEWRSSTKGSMTLQQGLGTQAHADFVSKLVYSWRGLIS